MKNIPDVHCLNHRGLCLCICRIFLFCRHRRQLCRVCVVNIIVPLSKNIVSILKSMRRTSKSEYIIADGTKPVFMRSYQRSFELLLKKNSIEHNCFLSLRHTFVTRALECGMDVKSLSEILGYKNAIITLNRYSHSMWEHKV